MKTTFSRKGLSKSRYTLFRQCAKALWLNAYKPEEAVIDPSLQARFEAGNEVGDLAMGYLGPFTEVTSFDENGRLDLKEMIRKTRECIDAGVENIAEASFSWEGNYCAVDILHRQDGGHAIYEVKSSSGTPSQSETDEEYVKYARDIAYQKYVLEKSGVKVTGTYLIRINKDYVRGDELDIHSFFYHVDLHELVNQESLVIEKNIGKARETLASESEPEIPIGTHCQNPYGCAFWQYCTRDVPHPSVFNLYRMPFDDKIELFNKGNVTFEQLRGEALSDKQHTQVECTLTGARHINPDGIKEWLDTLTYPLYFLDFETMQSVVPQYPGTRPYQQVTFQYSLHYIEAEGGELKHKEFLGISGEDPRRALAEQLCADIPTDVCTMAYNKSFECGRIRELAEAFPDLAEHLLNIESHIVDLIDPFRAGHCYLPAMDGSFSIKKVLPALFPEDPELDYHNLSGGVQNGGDAMTIFPRIKDMTPEEQPKARRALLDYCCLDTYAMVKVWGKLINIMEEGIRKQINAKVVDIICSSLTALTENQNIDRPNYRYLLNQAIRQYVPADANKHISEAALYVWEQLLGLDKNDIKNNYYDEIITRAPQACDVHIPTYKGNNKTGYESFAVQDKFNFNKIFIVEHTTPVADIIDALRKLDKPINSNNVQEILEKIHTTTMLKIEDRRIKKSSGRIRAEDIKKNRSNDIFKKLVKSFYSKKNLKILSIKFDDQNLEKLYNKGIQINP